MQLLDLYSLQHNNICASIYHQSQLLLISQIQDKLEVKRKILLVKLESIHVDAFKHLYLHIAILKLHLVVLGQLESVSSQTFYS